MPGTKPRKEYQKTINLALQGGGAHGAFTWGVLDKLFEDGRIWIEAISGTSAGAMNAVAVAHGVTVGGDEGARETLEKLWHTVSEAGTLSPLKRGPLDVFMGSWGLEYSPGYIASDLMTRLTSPYELNPLNFNPLERILKKAVDFDAVRACQSVALYISATNVETGRVRVFESHEVTPDVVMASACLPTMFQAVEIDGVPYWDGGYAGNPVLFPFFERSRSADIVIVQINPIKREGTPKSARDIIDRANEITFNQSLLKELRAIDFVRRLMSEGKLDNKHYRSINMHMVHARREIRKLGASSKLNTEWDFLRHLFEVGRDAATRWLEENFDAIGEESTVNIRDMFQGN